MYSWWRASSSSAVGFSFFCTLIGRPTAERWQGAGQHAKCQFFIWFIVCSVAWCCLRSVYLRHVSCKRAYAIQKHRAAVCQDCFRLHQVNLFIRLLFRFLLRQLRCWEHNIEIWLWCFLFLFISLIWVSLSEVKMNSQDFFTEDNLADIQSKTKNSICLQSSDRIIASWGSKEGHKIFLGGLTSTVTSIIFKWKDFGITRILPKLVSWPHWAVNEKKP